MSQVNYLDKTPLIVKNIRDETQAIRTFGLVRADGAPLPEVSAGAHLMFHLPNGLTRQYSLINAAGPAECFYVSILKDPKSRGGSAYFHNEVKVGDTLIASGPKNHFPLVVGAARNLLIGGGIGITPIFSMASTLFQDGRPFELHYCAKSPEETAFLKALQNCPFAGHVHFHFDGGNPSKGLDIKSLLTDLFPGQHLFCCGPAGLMDAVEAAASHWPRGSVHFERFKAGAQDSYEDKPFDLLIKSTGQKMVVPVGKSALQVLAENGFEIESVCEEGVCGSCLVNVLDGEPEHRDQILNEQERESNEVMLVCCSRARSDSITIDL